MSSGGMRRIALSPTGPACKIAFMKWLAALAVCAALAAAPAAVAQEPPTFREVAAEIAPFMLPGPAGAEERAVFVWRPRAAGDAVLPVLYMADGAMGIYSILVVLKPQMEAGDVAPFMIVATNPHPAERTAEYVPDWRANPRLFEPHYEWFIDVVLPWAEREHHAAADRAQRAIGGYSNGADFALAAAGRRGDLFSGVLAHSPMNFSPAWLGDGAMNIRWAVTGGTQEPAGAIAREVGRTLARRGAARRICIGRWRHEPAAWRPLTADSVVWIMNSAARVDLSTPQSRQSCDTHAAA